jgi:hypothetical protein
MQDKNDSTVTATIAPRAPKWTSVLHSPEAVHQMASKFGFTYAALASAKSNGPLSHSPAEVHQMASRLGFDYSVASRATGVPVVFRAPAPVETTRRSGAFSYSPADIHKMALKCGHSYNADVFTPAIFHMPTGARAVKQNAMNSNYSLVEMHIMATKLGINPVKVSGRASPVAITPTPTFTPTAVTTPRAPSVITETSESTDVARIKTNTTLGYSSDEMREMGWTGANFITVAAVTSAGIVAVQSPIKTVLANLSKNGTFIPPYKGGIYGLVRVLYAGTSASLSGSAVRTAYVTSTKNSKPTELVADGMVREEAMVREEGIRDKVSGAKLQYVMSATLGELLVTQVSESLSTLKKVQGLIPKDFNWKTPHNFSQLMTGGIVPRFASGMVNFSCLCLLEDKISRALPIESDKIRHASAGAVSGATAAIVGYPFSSFKDYVLVRATVTTDGKLVNMSPTSVLKEMATLLRDNPKQAFRTFASSAAKQMPMKAGMTATIYSIVSGVGETLGKEPLDAIVSKRPAKSSTHGFFSGSSTTSATTKEALDTLESGKSARTA